ncbi:dentin sialophosphoprotein-like [Juglans microcarpa x Juglans regia]|uniref:dentin sialophosphoprotein-like n=1 Tax=Juglans microcarpa x Juglans regia TaxID=2249226 RepID=UPI001B7F1FF9|nr:dentin sialophosphoprotein-like [Juglans microcarpa x Juglans regia]
MAARYNVDPLIPAAEYYSGLMQAYLDQLQVDLRRQLQQQRPQSTEDEPNQAENGPVQQISTTISTDDSASSTFSDDEEAFLKEHDDEADYSSGDYSEGDYSEGDSSEGDYSEGDYSEGDSSEGDYSDGYPFTSLVVSVLAELGIYLSDGELDELDD